MQSHNVFDSSNNIKTEVSEFNAMLNSCDKFSVEQINRKLVIPSIKPKLSLNSHKLILKKKTEDTNNTKDDDSADVPEDEDHTDNPIWSS